MTGVQTCALPIFLTQVAYVDDKKILNNYGTPEENAITDDVLRLNGVWQLPGLQR